MDRLEQAQYELEKFLVEPRVLPEDLGAAEAFDSLADRYDETFLSAEALAENAVAFGALGDVTQESVLDAGCGTGLFLEYCSPGAYLGIDISGKMLAKAAGKFPSRLFVQADMADLSGVLPRGGGKVDRVVSTFGSFSYCLAPERAARELWRVLRPGGKLFLMAFSRRYFHRKTHICGEGFPFIGYSAKGLYAQFRLFRQITVWGLNAISGRFTLPPGPLTRLMRAEARSLGRAHPDACYFLVVEATK